MLSDAAVREKIGKEFVAFAVNITDDGFPANAPALELYRRGYEARGWHKLGFTVTAICDPMGAFPIGWSGNGSKDRFFEAAAYHPDLYLKFLDRSLKCRKLQIAILESGLPTDDKDRMLKSLLSMSFQADPGQVDRFLKGFGKDVRLSAR